MNRKCPACNKPVEATSDKKTDESNCLPFCSERCKLVDLGAWLEEEYKIASQVGPGQDEDAYEFA
jgi:hypothetical protein